ncbi:kinase-like domain-containing protein [Gigaspora rosea]|uniref:Kinase-like domain-containing protein n=1 Tax=Gigaspora rosea TaxID=44941 RepID=A0A397UEC3_9GLOM|nr:kinase-like domain-containing protein [Gigaspora rosea]
MTEATSLIDERFFDLDSIAYTEPQCLLKIKYENNLAQEPDVYVRYNLTQKSDIYSLGVVLWEISSGKPPFRSFIPRESLAIHILKGNREEPMEKDTPQQYIELYKKCWDNVPDKRPEMNEILEILTNIYYQKIDEIEHIYEKWEIDKGSTCENKELNCFIKESQLKAKHYDKVIEWIPFDKLKKIQEIGKGGSGTVYSATWLDGKRIRSKENNKLVSKREECKVALKPSIKKVIKDISKEFKTFVEFGNQKDFFEIFGITYSPKQDVYFMVCQYADRGNLWQYLEENFRKLTWAVKLELLFYAAYNLSRIHNMGYVHKNIHSGNILLVNTNGTADIKPYISDFGLSNRIEYKTSGGEIFGVLPYVAPEILLGNEYTTAADIYSFGIILTEVSTGIPPYYEIINYDNDNELAAKICKGLRPEFGKGTPDIYIELAKQCMDEDQKKRPSAGKVCQKLFNWYHIFDFECLNEEEVKIKKAFLNDNKTEILGPINREHNIYTSKVIKTQMISDAFNMLSGGFYISDSMTPDDIYWQGYRYEYGIEVEKDENRAFKIYQVSAEKNNPNGMYQVGYCYHLGIGVEADEHKAFTHYLESAKNDNSMGIFKAAICYYYGIGIEKNGKESENWIKK